MRHSCAADVLRTLAHAKVWLPADYGIVSQRREGATNVTSRKAPKSGPFYFAFPPGRAALRVARATHFMNTSQSDKAAPRWTMDGFRLGAWEILPLLPGLFAFGMAFGTVAASVCPARIRAR
jgi:hypothetical protein